MGFLINIPVMDFTTIPYYHLFNSDCLVKAVLPIEEGTVLQKAGYYLQPEQITKHPYICIVPDAFKDYENLIAETCYLKTTGLYLSLEETGDESVFDKTFLPLINIIDEFIFAEVIFFTEAEDSFIKIKKIFNTAAIWHFVLKRNRYSNKTQWKHLGIGNGIFNLMPPQHHYYDRNMICTCGEEGCGNTEVWYIKYENDYAVPFVVDLNQRLVLDLNYIATDYNDWEEADYIEGTYTRAIRNSYHTFPFCFEAKDFKLLKKHLAPNPGSFFK